MGHAGLLLPSGLAAAAACGAARVHAARAEHGGRQPRLRRCKHRLLPRPCSRCRRRRHWRHGWCRHGWRRHRRWRRRWRRGRWRGRCHLARCQLRRRPREGGERWRQRCLRRLHRVRERRPRIPHATLQQWVSGGDRRLLEAAEVLPDCHPVVLQVLLVGGRCTVLELHLQIGDGPQPELPLRKRPGGELVVLDGEAAAVDANFLATDRALRDVDVHHAALADLALVEHQQRLVLAVRMQLAIEHRSDEAVVVVDEVARHETVVRAGHSVDGLTRDAEGGEEGLRHQPHRARYVEDPARAHVFGLALVCTANSEVVADALGKERHLEYLEVREIQAGIVALELAVSHERKGRQGDRHLVAVVREGEAVDVQREGDEHDRFFGEEMPELALAHWSTTQRLVHGRGVGLQLHELRGRYGRVVDLVERVELGA
mmetsp:Transcript_21215/g.65707  ORF Transcript_21215/g.65707 Transcript_21215/m.65707 type:complete len:430 (-) Transcript_21215:87-1376(-)